MKEPNDSQALDCVMAMRAQEDKAYLYSNYLATENNTAVTQASSCEVAAYLNGSFRTEFAEWCYHIVDSRDFSRETVFICMSYFDRYTATLGQKVTLDEAHLAAITSLYLAVKINETEKLSLEKLAKNFGNKFTLSHLKNMEIRIILALEWRLTPPTPTAFVRNLLDIPSMCSIPSYIKNYLYELSKFITELSVCDPSFVGVKPSIIAFASLLISLENVDAGHLSDCLLNELLNSLVLTLNPHTNDEIFIDKLRQLYFSTDFAEEESEETEQDENKNLQGDVNYVVGPPFCLCY